MKKQTIFIIIIVLIIFLVGGLAVLAGTKKVKSSSQLDSFAKCLADSGAKFYGTFWCPHCQKQKAEFGSSVKYLPYIECSTADGKGQLDVCKEAGIEGYPTWVFANGERLSGEIPLETLASKTSCTLSLEQKVK